MTVETGRVRCIGTVVHPGRTGRDDRSPPRGRRRAPPRACDEHDPRARRLSRPRRATLRRCAATRKVPHVVPGNPAAPQRVAGERRATVLSRLSRHGSALQAGRRRGALAADLGGRGPLRGRARLGAAVVRHRGPAAERDGRAAHGARAERVDPGSPHPLPPHARLLDALAAGLRPRGHRDPERRRARAREGGADAPRPRPGGVPRANVAAGSSTTAA